MERYRKKKYKRLRCVALPDEHVHDLLDTSECTVEFRSRKPLIPGNYAYKIQESFRYLGFNSESPKLLVTIGYIDQETRVFDILNDYLDEMRGNKDAVKAWFVEQRRVFLARKNLLSALGSNGYNYYGPRKMPIFATRMRCVIDDQKIINRLPKSVISRIHMRRIE